MLSLKQNRAVRAVSAKRATARPAGLSARQHQRSLLSPVPGYSVGVRNNRQVLARSAAKDEIDFDKFLIVLATKWEESENKAIVVGYSVAAVSAFFIAEWFIHLPVLDFLVGFPIQLLGILTLPWIVVRWLVDKKDWYDDVSGVTGYLVGKLPYLEKKK